MSITRYHSAAAHGYDILAVLDAFDYGLVVHGGWDGLYGPNNLFATYEEAKEAAQQMLAVLDALPERIVAYRALVVSSPDEIEEPYGKHWSLSKDLAIDIAKEEEDCGGLGGDTSYVVEGAIPSSAVNWHETIAHWIVYSAEWGGGAGEDEIYVEDQDAVRLLDVHGPVRC